MKSFRHIGLVFGFLLIASQAVAARAVSDAEAQKLLEEMERRNAAISTKVVAIVQESFEDSRIAREFLVYNDAEKERMTMLFTRPKSQAGSGVLRVERNIWFYDASVGKWTRQTERDRVGGTNLRASDLTSSFYATRYTAKDAGEAKVDGKAVRKVVLTAKPEADVPFPKVTFWLDSDLFPVVREDYALSGRLLRTTRSTKTPLPRKGAQPMWAPKRMVIQDAVDKNRVTQIDFNAWVAGAIEDSVFTKAWMETRSR